MNDETTNKPETPSTEDETLAWTDEGAHDVAPAPGRGREWLGQLQSLIENASEQAGPVLKQVSAKAAELATVAGEKAGPMAARAAELTADAGNKLAERSRDLAAELRQNQAAKASSDPNRPKPDPEAGDAKD